MARIPTVIKASQAGDAHLHMERMVRGSFQLDDVLEEARRSVTEARREADTLLQSARREAETLRREAGEEGYRAGFAQGRSEGEQAGRREVFEAARREFADQQGALTAAWTAALEQIDANRAEWLAGARHDLIELAMAIADRVVHCIGQRERAAIEANLGEAIRLTGRRSEVTVQVNPADAAAARAFAEEAVRRQEALENVRVQDCEDLAPGGCRVVWGDGSVDASIDTQLERIANALGVSRRPRGKAPARSAKEASPEAQGGDRQGDS